MVYQGSKRRIMRHIKPIIQSYAGVMDYYIEPFGGGLNSALHIEHPRKIISDVNPYVVALFNGLRDGLAIPDLYNFNAYTAARLDVGHNAIFSDFQIACFGLLASFGAKFFGGHITVSKTRNENHILNRTNNILKDLPFFNFEYFCSPYDAVHIPPYSLVYLDPPYKGTTGYKTAFDYAAFEVWARALAARDDVIVLLSERTPMAGATLLWQGAIQSSLGDVKTTYDTELLLIL